MSKGFEFVNEGAKRDFLILPDEIKRQFGSDLNAVQQNLDPYSRFKNVANSVGAGAIELIENGSPAYRVVYCAKYLDTVFILHAFTKTTNSVDKPAMSVAKARYKEMKAKVDKAKLATKKSKSKKRR